MLILGRRITSSLLEKTEKMFIDIVAPKGNEREMIAMAERLGIRGLALFYESPLESHNRVEELKQQTQVRLYTASLKSADITVSDISRGNNKAKIIIGLAQPLRHSFYKELADRGVAVCFPLSGMLSSRHRQDVVENAMRNIRLCREHKVMVVAASFASEPYLMRAENDIRQLFLSLGMGTMQAKDAVTAVYGFVRKA